MPLDTGRAEVLKTKKRLSNEKIAAEIGVKTNTVGRWLRGESQPTSLNLSQLAEVLKTSSDYLLGHTNDPTPPKPITPDDLTSEEWEIINARRSGNWKEAMRLFLGEAEDD